MVANWSVTAGPGRSQAPSCQATRFTSGRWVIATPLGRPVEPEV